MTYDVIAWRALDSRVLVVATRRVEGAWSCYIGPCPGNSHEAELEEVCAHGSRLDPRLARFIFPHIEGPYAR